MEGNVKMELRDMSATQLKELTRTSILAKDTPMLRRLQHEAQRRCGNRGIVTKSTPEGIERAREYLRTGVST